MSTFTFELDFRDDKHGESLYPAVAQIYIKNSSRDEGGPACITPHCVTVQEFDSHVDRLHEELESLRRRGHARFAAEKITQ